MYIAFFLVIAESVASGLFNFGKATLYDIQKIKKIKRQPRTKKQASVRQYIEVVIYNYNNAQAIAQSLQSVLNQDYRNFHVIVVDNHSTDDSLKIIRHFIKTHPNEAIRLVAKKKKTERETAVLQPLKKHAASTLVLVMDAVCTLESHALGRADQHFIENGNSAALLLNIQISHNDMISGLLQQTRERFSLSAKKALRFDKALSSGNLAAVYQKSFLRSLKKGSKQAINDTRALQNVIKKQNSLKRLAFDEMIGAQAGALPYRMWLADRLRAIRARPITSHISLRNIIYALQPFIVIYVAYVALAYHVYSYLLLAFFTFVVFLLLNIAFDRSQKPLAKLRAGFVSIPIYSMFIIDSLIIALISPFYLRKR